MNQKKQHDRSRKVACVATLTAAGLSFGLIACGNGGGGTGSTDTPETTARVQDPRGGPAQLTAKQRKCLAKQGVSTPGAGSGGSSSSPPDQSSMPDPDEMTAALEACGVELPGPPSGQGQGSMPQPPSGQDSGSMPQPPSGQPPSGGAPPIGQTS